MQYFWSDGVMSNKGLRTYKERCVVLTLSSYTDVFFIPRMA